MHESLTGLARFEWNRDDREILPKVMALAHRADGHQDDFLQTFAQLPATGNLQTDDFLRTACRAKEDAMGNERVLDLASATHQEKKNQPENPAHGREFVAAVLSPSARSDRQVKDRAAR
ncbi:MAG: hypothetical protein AMXMBFR33_71490 [Candidatus Xenobia bacterium]